MYVAGNILSLADVCIFFIFLFQILDPSYPAPPPNCARELKSHNETRIFIATSCNEGFVAQIVFSN